MRKVTGGYFIDPVFGEWLLTPEAIFNHGDKLLNESFQYWIENIASPKDSARVRNMATLFRMVTMRLIEGAPADAATDAIHYGESLLRPKESK